MANYGPEITNYYAPYRYNGKRTLVGGSGSGGGQKPKYAVQPGQSVTGSRGWGEGGGRGER